MNLTAIFSKTGKGVQEASGKSSHLSRADRGVLAAIDGKTTLAELQGKFEKLAGPKFEALIKQLDKDGFIREVSTGPSSVSPVRPAAPVAKPAPKPKPKADEGDDALDFTQPMDKAEIQAKAAAAAAAKPAADRTAAEAKAKAEAELKARAAAEAKAKAEAEAKAKAHAEGEARVRAEAEAKVKAAREAAMRLAAEAKAKTEAEAKAKEEAKAKAEAAEREKARVEAELGAKLEAERKAREEAERRAAELAEREKARVEAELRDRLEAERKAREEAERRAAETLEKARTELEQTSKRQAEELRKFLAAEMQAKLEEERKAREAEDRKRREEDDRRRAEEDEARAREDVKRRAREETDRKKRDEEDRRRREEDERHREEEKARRAKEEAERRERDEADRKRRDDEESRRKKEEEERRAKEDGERKSKSERKAKEKEEAERKAKDEAERRAKEEAEAKARAAAEVAASLPDSAAATLPPVPPMPAVGDIGGLLGDLESFGKREEEEQKAKEEAERKAKEEAERRAKEEAERRAKEEAERKAKEEAERKEKEEAERKAKEEEERKEKEEAKRKKEEEAERKRKAKEALAAKQAEERAARKRHDSDVRDEELKEERAAAGRGAKVTAAARPRKWGKPAAIALFVLLVGGVGVLNLMPVSTAEYETAASETLGVPVKIGSARMSVLTGVEVVFERVTIGDAVQIRLARGFPELGSLFGDRKVFSRVELEGVSISPSQAGDALFGKAAGDSFRMGRLLVKQLNVDGSLKLPPLDVDALVAGNGSLQTVKLKGPDNLAIELSPKGSDIAFEIKAGTFALPFVPALSLSEFAMKGNANRRGVTASEFDGRAYDGVISGTARIAWGAGWTVDGEVKARNTRVGVFAPALMSEGRVEARANYTMSGAAPATLYESARMQGEFRIEKGVMGSFDITRALQTGGAQSAGRTAFNELTGQGTYDRGAIQLRNISATAGAMSAGASLDIDANGGLSGRIVADVKAANQNLRATLNFSGKVQDPVIRK